MVLNADSMKPIYVQIADWLENEILNDHIQEDEKMFSQYQLADMYTINPATAAKGLTLLADENILYKKRGLGMFVSPNAKECIIQKRKNETLQKMVIDLVTEAKRLHVDKNELIQMMITAEKQIEGELI